MALAGGSIAGIVLGSIFGFVLLLFLLLVAFRFYNRRNTAGSDNIKQLQGKTVVITGKQGFFQISKHFTKNLCKNFILKFFKNILAIFTRDWWKKLTINKKIDNFGSIIMTLCEIALLAL